MDLSVLKNRAFLFILFTAFLSILGFGIIMPVIPYIIQKYVPSTQLALYVGVMVALYSFCQFFAGPVLGALSDRYGRRPILLFCLLGSAIGYILFGIGGSLIVLFIARIIDGLTGGDVATAMAYIADVTEPKDRGKYFGTVGALVGFGFIVGPTLGGLAATISLSMPLYIAAALTIINMIYGYFVLPESLDKKHRTTDFTWHHLNPLGQLGYVLSKHHLKILLGVGLFYALAFSQVISITSVFFKDTYNWTAFNLGIFFFVLGITDMFTQGFLAGRLTTKFGFIKVLFLGFAFTTIAYFINAIIPIFPFVFLTFVYIVIYSLGSGLFEPSLGGLTSSSAGRTEQGRVQGASQSVQALTRIVSPLVAAFLYQINHSLPWISCIIFSLFGAYLLYRYRAELTEHIHTIHEG